MSSMQLLRASAQTRVAAASAGRCSVSARTVPARVFSARPMACKAVHREEQEVSTSSPQNQWLTAALTSAPAVFLLQQAAPALAKDGELGILEGRTAALLHPAFEFFLLGATLYAGYLGIQWRRTRELGEEIRALRSAAPAAADGAAALPNPALEAKEQERKALLAGNFKDKHFVWGSLLLASGIGMAIEGCANTFIRTGRLFPGPHLYAGAGICALWALAAAFVPAMQKGDNNARNAHIALNTIQVALFLSQVPSGLEIVAKVFEFTSWP